MEKIMKPRQSSGLCRVTGSILCGAKRSRLFLGGLLLFSLLGQAAEASQEDRPPNFILILCDNLGYGDIGCFGSKLHHTPNVDRLAREGMKLTSFYMTAGVCTPSRASLMTGCYARRVGMQETDGAVLRPVSRFGLHPDEVTVAEVLKEEGYATACIGKWHLGDQPVFLPTRQGFDYYYGIPYSDDMTQREGKNWPPLPLMRNEKVIEAPANRSTLTKRYTSEAIRFIRNHEDRPFLLYLAHSMPGSTSHPFASKAFKGHSENGAYGDAVEEIDWSTGQIMAALKALELEQETVILWTSDNGAPKRQPPQGRNQPLGGWGYTTMEGGMRVPCVVRWPGNIPAGESSDALVTSMDLMPTLARLAGAAPPQDRIIDGQDIRPILTGAADAESPHDVFYYYHVDQLQAVRSGRWKLHLPKGHHPLKLFDLKKDVAETENIASRHPGIVKRLRRLAKKGRKELGEADDRGENQRAVGTVSQPVPLRLSH